MSKKTESAKKRDIILVAVCLVIALAGWLFLHFTATDGIKIQVKVSGTLTAEYFLSQSGTYEIHGAGGGTNLLVISGGEAWLTEASCPDKLCVGMGKISRGGQSIICLPNQVVVEVVGDESEDAVDFVTGR